MTSLFLTSSPYTNDVPEGTPLPCLLNPANGFVRRLRERYKPDARLLTVCADPHAPFNDEIAETFRATLAREGMRASGSVVLDGRNEERAAELVALCDAILLAGGHVPTQLAFFEQIGLRALLSRFTGLIVGVSAGSMNCAGTVYAQPEMPGESVAADYERFPRGLGLTDVMLVPHLQKVRHDILDGRRLIDDITCEDSMGRRFIAVPDGSYVLCENGRATLFGEGYAIADGRMEKLCDEGGEIGL